MYDQSQASERKLGLIIYWVETNPSALTRRCDVIHDRVFLDSSPPLRIITANKMQHLYAPDSTWNYQKPYNIPRAFSLCLINNKLTEQIASFQAL